jgi:Zn-dependent peptidase ImmA (M78 family)
MTEKKISSRSNTPSVVATLRGLVPHRPLSFTEACRVAELQANHLLQMTESTSAPVVEEVITELPRLSVTRAGSLIGSGLTAWSRGKWRVRINSAEPVTRQRFTLAHEFKHILDAACEDEIYRHLPEGPARERHIEAVCDHFSACLLMPKAWVKKAWGEGVQDLAALAWRFEVSQQAMLIRLQSLGLIEPLPRHGNWQRIGTLAVRGSRRRTRRTYRRSSVSRYVSHTQDHSPSPIPVLAGSLP